jgi:putative peptide zinc metalloprotease protein
VTQLPITGDARPRRVAEVKLRRRDDGVIVLCHGGRYVSVSARGLEVWQSFDGTVDLRDVAHRYQGAEVADVMPALIALTRTLAECGLVTLDSPPTPSSEVGTAAVARSARNLLEGYFTFSPERALERAYRLFRPACHRMTVAGAALVAFVGLVLFLTASQRFPFHASVGGIVTLALAMCVAAVLHEAAHALTLRHFGGTVSRAGVGWYWFAATAFVDTSDAHFLPGNQRVAVALAGPVADAAFAGGAALLAAGLHDAGVAGWAMMLATTTYARLLWNVNPLLETDWYYALTDVLGRPNLRHDGFAQLFSHRLRRDGIALTYGAAALLYAIVYCIVGIPTLVHSTLVVWLAPAVPAAVAAMLPVAAAVVAVFSIGIALYSEQRARSARLMPAWSRSQEEASNRVGAATFGRKTTASEMS